MKELRKEKEGERGREGEGYCAEERRDKMKEGKRKTNKKGEEMMNIGRRREDERIKEQHKEEKKIGNNE